MRGNYKGVTWVYTDCRNLDNSFTSIVENAREIKFMGFGSVTRAKQYINEILNKPGVQIANGRIIIRGEKS
jgi:hypothetical protein